MHGRGCTAVLTVVHVLQVSVRLGSLWRQAYCVRTIPAAATGSCSAELSLVATLAGRALRRAGTQVSFSVAEGSTWSTVLGVFEAPSIWSFAIANVLLPEVLQQLARLIMNSRAIQGHIHLCCAISMFILRTVSRLSRSAWSAPRRSHDCTYSAAGWHLIRCFNIAACRCSQSSNRQR